MTADPHAFRGAHPADGGVVIRTVRPAAREVTVYVKGKAVAKLEPADTDGLFEGVVPKAKLPLAYELEVDYGDGTRSASRTPTASRRRSGTWTSTSPARAATRRSTPASART